MSHDGWVALPCGVMGLSAVCDCGISWSYSLTNTFYTCWNWILQYGLQIGAAYYSLGRTKVLYVSSLVLLGAKAKFLGRKPKVLVALDEISEICWPQSMFSVIVIPRYSSSWDPYKTEDANYLDKVQWWLHVMLATTTQSGPKDVSQQWLTH